MTSKSKRKLHLASEEEKRAKVAAAAATDPFVEHLQFVIPPHVIGHLQSPAADHISNGESPLFAGSIRTQFRSLPAFNDGSIDKSTLMADLHVKKRLVDNASKLLLPGSSQLSEKQFELLSTLGRYHDVHYNAAATDDVVGEIRLVYCLHALNHLLKTRQCILRHNEKIKSSSARTSTTIGDEYRDQGFARAKVLILLPFRQSALRCVEVMIRLLGAAAHGDAADDGEPDFFQVMNRRRFHDEFGWDSEDPVARLLDRPADFRALFAGNTDDKFRLGLKVTKRSLKLFTSFSQSDIIIASPLSLRQAIDASDSDFLSSIEIVVIDQADVCWMQNWQHLLHCMEMLNRRPESMVNMADIGRIRRAQLDGLAKFYRQTLLFSAFPHCAFDALMAAIQHGGNKPNCCNYRGSLLQWRDPGNDAPIEHLTTPAQLLFHRIDSSDPDARFSFFESVCLPRLSGSDDNGLILFVPSYFDYVRLRNLLRRESVSFTHLCEYSSSESVNRARDAFFHRRRRMLLLSGRFHFYHRYRLRGATQLFFYALPDEPRHFSELINFANAEAESTDDGSPHGLLRVDVLFSPVGDYRTLVATLGKERTRELLDASRTRRTITLANRTD